MGTPPFVQGLTDTVIQEALLKLQTKMALTLESYKVRNKKKRRNTFDGEQGMENMRLRCGRTNHTTSHCRTRRVTLKYSAAC